MTRRICIVQSLDEYLKVRGTPGLEIYYRPRRLRKSFKMGKS